MRREVFKFTRGFLLFCCIPEKCDVVFICPGNGKNTSVSATNLSFIKLAVLSEFCFLLSMWALAWLLPSPVSLQENISFFPLPPSLKNILCFLAAC